MFTKFIYSLGDLFEATFTILPKLGNLPNVIFIVIGFILFFIWLNQMSKYNKEAEQNGTLK